MAQAHQGDVAQDDLELRATGVYETVPESGLRISKKRKLFLILIDLLTVISLILVSNLCPLRFTE